MKVLRVITRLNIGGPARQALALTRDLAPRYETVLASGRPTEIEGEISDPLVEVQRVPLSRPVSPANDVRAYRALKALVHRHHPRLVHTHMAKAGTLGRLVAMRSAPRPVIVHTFHGHVLSGYFSAPMQAAFIRTERALGRRSTCLIAVSVEIRDELLALGIGQPDKWRVIPVGIDLTPFANASKDKAGARRSLSLPARSSVIAIVGRLIPIKDHQTLLKALAGLPDVQLLVAGDGELKTSLERLAADLGLASRVRFLGWADDIASVYAAADVTVLSSLREGTPVALIESLATSRPVVATDVGGVRSVVEDGRTGLLVPPGDADALSHAIDELLSDSGRRAAMGKRGPKAVSKFSLERLVSETRSLYDELLSDKRVT